MHRNGSLLRVIGLAIALGSWTSPAPGQSQGQGQAPQGPEEPATAGSPNGPGPGAGSAVPRFGPQAADPLLILQAPAVQRELKLTEEQKTKVTKLARSAGQRSRGRAQGTFLDGEADLQGLPAAGAGGNRRQIDRELTRILDRGQRERLHQIAMQAEGPLAVARPEVARRLNLTPEQAAGVQATLTQWSQAQREVLLMGRANGAFGDPPNPDAYAQVRLASTRLRRHAAQQIGQLLERRQQLLLEKALGAPFDLGKLNGGDTPNAQDKDKDKADVDAGNHSQRDDSSPKKAQSPRRPRGRRERAKGQA
jgi:hypothetical protein